MHTVEKIKIRNNTITMIKIPTDGMNAAGLIDIINKEYNKLRVWDMDRMTKISKEIKKALNNLEVLNKDLATSILKRLFSQEVADKVTAQNFNEAENYFLIVVVSLPKVEVKVVMESFESDNNATGYLDWAKGVINEYKC